MMSRIRVFDHISVKIPFTAIQRRMGFNRKHNLSGTGDISGVRGIIENANDLIRVKGAAVRLGIEVKEDSVRFENGYIMKSRMTAGLLKECSEALVMGGDRGGIYCRRDRTSFCRRGDAKGCYFRCFGK